ncbi:MAG: carbon-nitrogen hydrolase family protein [Candidatus Sumerlaeota bacterium]
MSNLRIAMIQALASGWDVASNQEKGLALCRQAAERRADIVLFPEMWSVGYGFPDLEDEKSIAQWRGLAQTREGPFVSAFRKLAREREIAIAVTYLESCDPAPRNTLSLLDSSGEIVLNYSKVHTCDFGDESATTPGDGFRVATLQTRIGPVKIGAMICYDREIPESARILMLRGAEIILVPNACGLHQHRLNQFKTRAYENMVGLAMANYPAPHANGHSIAVHPMALDKSGNPQDIVVAEAGEDEKILMAEFDMDAIRDYRNRECWGNAYRKPRTYELITSEKVEPPFLRDDARR